MGNNKIKVGIAQIAPVWLNRDQTLEKILKFTGLAGNEDCQLVTFGEALLPGYPFWIERTNGAKFNSKIQKDLHAHYIDQSVDINAGDLEPLCESAKKNKMAIYLGCIDKAADRGRHSLYCTMVYIDPEKGIQSVHRKLMPTYEERLTWAPGDGHGLRVHNLGPFTVGGLNCWENWMPLARTALYAQGEDLHVAIWPGSVHNTSDITRFMAKESRSYIISASAVMRPKDFPKTTPHLDKILSDSTDFLANGGSCIAGPDGEWVVEPCIEEERLITAVIDHQCVRAERQNFDPVGHYSRPDVLELRLNRTRQTAIKISDLNDY